uniref:Uncharacterized protein n=1 Tax=Cacopsylla melanoneura TaxID=428564 RepID=A0A8D9F5S9_9HEMI
MKLLLCFFPTQSIIGIVFSVLILSDISIFSALSVIVVVFPILATVITIISTLSIVRAPPVSIVSVVVIISPSRCSAATDPPTAVTCRARLFLLKVDQILPTFFF